VLVLAVGAAVAGATGASASTALDPGPLGTAVDAVDAVGAPATRLVPVPLPSDPTEPVTGVVGTVTGALTGPAGTPSGSGSQPGAQQGSGRATGSSSPAAKSSASRADAAPAAQDDTVVAADVTVRDLLGACVRLTRAGVPVRTTIEVLDRNLIDQLTAVGLPLDRLLVPCPAAATTSASAASSGTTSAATTTDRLAAAGVQGLAFTGIDLAPTVLLAGGLLALGLAFLRKASALGEVRVARPEDA
jgi:hypothetical protein